MPSFKELAKSAHRTLCRCLATIILSFCGISSFGMISIKGILGLGTAAALSLAVLATLSTPAFADQTSKSLDVNLTLGNSISVRILDSTATSDLSLLSFDLTPTASGVTSTKRAIVDVSTSNITGYKLYVEANGKDHNNQYTTDLVQGDTADSHVIPTSTSTASNKNFWNYVNPATSTATVVPAHGNPDQIGMLMSPTTSTKANVDINVGVDTTITAGSYTNQLLFTAIANAESIDYTLYFDKNAPSGVDPSDIENFPVNQTASASATSYTFTIPDTAPTLVGYTFGGYVDPTATPGSKGSSADPYLPGENVTVLADPTASVISGTKTLNAKWTIIRPTLTVDPDGGTWSGSSSAQTFEQDYGTTKHIDLPSANATYTISYNDNSQGATFTPTPTSAERSFTEWQLAATRSAGPGSWDPATSTYTFGTTNGTLTAVYNSTSNTFTLPTVTKTGHTCTWHENSASGTSHTSGETNVTITANTEFYAVCDANSYTLTVNPNGGTWSGSSSSQEFSQNYGTTKSIANPSAGPTYSISYDGNSQSASYDPTPTSVQRPFTDWTLTATPSGAAHGSFSEGTYTYGVGDDTLTANYSNTSNSFTLPQISKTGHSCKWAEGSASGTQYDGGTSRTITGNTTYYAVCTINQYTLTIKPNGGKWNSTTSDSTFTQNYNTRYPASGSLNNATEGPSYTIDYNMGSTGITKPTSPTSVHRAFDSWTKSGTGTWDATNKYWTFGAGDGALTASWSNTSEGFTLPALQKTGHTCKWHLGSASGTEYGSGATNVTITGNSTFYAVCTVNQYTLTVNPNGGTWNGSTSSQQFAQNYGTTKTIANPTAGATYAIGYDMGSTGITAPTSPTAVQRSFSSWSLSGAGSFAGNTYTYEAGNGTLTASYSGTSNAFTLPALQKTGHTCKWHLGSASGTEYASGATNVTITGNSTFYATCTANNYTVSITNSNTTSGASSLSVPYGDSRTVTVTPNSGYYLSNVSCPSGYTCSGYSTGTSGQQTVTVKNNNTTSGGTLAFTGTLAPSIQNQTNIDTCKNAATGTTYALRDERDNNVYTVAKLADGKCWMTQNLRLTGSRTLTSSDSDVSSNWTLPAETAGTFDWGDTCVDTAYNMKSTTATTYASYGNYYNWYAATAGTGTCSRSSGNASSSICPRGWRLPTGGYNREFQTLYNNYNSASAMMSSPVNFAPSGRREGSRIMLRDLTGYYWSSTADSSYYANYLYIASSGAGPAYYNYKYLGYTVRCVAR